MYACSMTDEETKTSQYNAANLQILNLHDIWINCRKYRKAGQYALYRWELDSAEVELNADAVRLDKDNRKDKNDSWTTKIEEINKQIQNSISSKDIEEVYKNMKEKEKLLKLLQESSGKGSKLKIDDDEGM